MSELDYDKMIFLDAENLAEGGISRAYEDIRESFSQYVSKPGDIEEVADDNKPSYLVRSGEQEYVIYSPELPGSDEESWGRATYAFFKIVNDQLARSAYRLFAINGGNDLGGMFLTQVECDAARKSLPRKQDWPYLPTLEQPWYGQPHD